MSDEKPGQALVDALKAREHRKGNRNAAANAAKERMFIRDSEATAEEHAAWQARLKREFLARNPHFLGAS